MPKRFLMVLLPLSALLGCFLVVIYYSGAGTESEAIEAYTDKSISFLEGVVSDELRPAISDLKMLSLHKELHDLLEADYIDETLAKAIGHQFLILLKSTQTYDQIRLLDERGKELIRVVYNSGNPRILTQRELQFKGDRYYFKGIMALEPGQVYLSPFDLNVEHGKVEKPFKPIIRLGIPIYDQPGHRRGALIINYLGAKLLDDFKAIAANMPGQAMLLNPAGYWLSGPSPDDEWGFMFEDRKERSFGRDFPDAWRRISQAESGQFYLGGDLFTFATVHPLLSDRRPDSRNGAIVGVENYYWKIVSYVPSALLNAKSNELINRLLLLFGVLVGLILLSSLYLGRLSEQTSKIQVGVLSPFYILVTMGTSIFILEAFVMTILSFVLPPVSPVIEAFIDSTLLLILLSPILYLLLFRPLYDHIRETRLATEALRKSEASLADAQRIARLGNWEWDIVTNKLTWSDEIYRLLEISREKFDATYEGFMEFIHPDDRDFVNESVDRALKGEAPYSIDHRIVLPGGKDIVVHEQAEVIFNNEGRPLRMIGTIQDITALKAAELEMKRLSAAIESSVNIVFVTDTHGVINYVNPMFESVTGYTKDEIIGQTPRLIACEDTPRAHYEEMYQTIFSGKTWRGTFKNSKKNGQHFWVNSTVSPIMNDKGEITQFLSVQEDITEKMRSKEQIDYLATHDETTGLLNRSHFIERLDKSISTSDADKNTGALLLINIDDFKSINEAYGHLVGDTILKDVAAAINRSINGLQQKPGELDAISARIGSNEFTLFLPRVDKNNWSHIVDGIKEQVITLRHKDVPVQLSVSIGVSLYPDHGLTGTDLLRHADAASIRARELGHNSAHLFRPEDRDLEKTSHRLIWKGRIQDALAGDGFTPWFQPILDLGKDRITHCEALVRMRTKDKRTLLPGMFIDIAEKFGLQGGVTRVVITKTIEYMAKVNAARKEPLTFSINLSGKDLGDKALLTFIQSKITETGINPGQLIFEITESAAIHEMDSAIRFIDALKSIGCRISLDDFGVGFTSFAYLKEMNIDYIKIDGSFIRRLHENQQDQLFVKAIRDVARGMGIQTVAEFVENEETLQLLREFGIDYAQGYLIGRPQPALEDGGFTQGPDAATANG